MGMAQAVAGIAFAVGDFGLSLSALRKAELTDGERNGLFWLNLLFSFAMALLLLLISAPAARFFNNVDSGNVIRAIAACFVLSGISVQFRVELMREQRFRRIAIIDVIAQSLSFAAALVCAVVGLRYWSLVIQIATNYAITLILLLLSTPWRPSLRLQGMKWREHLHFGGTVFLLQILNYISSNIDTIMIGRFIGPSITGLYTRAFQIIKLPLQQIATPLTRVVLTELSQIDVNQRAIRLAKLHETLVSIIIPLLTLISVFSDPGIAVIFGSQWQDSVPIIWILSIGAIFQTTGYIYYWTLLSLGRTRLLLFAELPGRTLSIILIIWLAPRGVLWVAGAYSIGQFLILLGSVVLSYAYSFRLPGGIFPPTIRALLLSSAIAVPALVVRYLSISGEFSQPLALLLMLIATVVAVLITMRVSQAAKQLLSALLRAFRKG